jgi:hypothetical protein
MVSLFLASSYTLRFETSAKDNFGIDKAAKFLIQKILDNKVTEKPVDTGLIDPKKPKEEEKVSKGCCN